MKRILLFILGIGLTAIVAEAHHSIAGAYDTNRKITIEGMVVQFHFVNPHPFLMMDVKQDGGGLQQWRLEMDNRSELSQVGMNADTLKPGDRVVVTGSPAREQSQSLYIQKLDRPADGFQYEQVGNSPRITRAPRQEE